MTVLQVCAFAAEYPGNFIATLVKLETELSQKGFKTIYAFPERASQMAWCKELAEQTKVYFLPEAHARIMPQTYKMFRDIYRENTIDIVHTHFELYDVPATIVAPSNTRVFWHLHDPIGDGFEKAGFARRLLTKIQYGYVGKRATLLTVSQKHGDFAASIGFPQRQIVYFPNGINTERIKRVDFKKDIEEKHFLMLGWDVYRKGVDVLVNALPLLNRRDFSVCVVGMDKCEKYLKQNSREAVIFLHPVTDINVLFERSQAFLHISRSEGQSYALLEAIYAGLPVICSDIPENSFAKQFKNLYWVNVGDSLCLAEMMEFLLAKAEPVDESAVAGNRKLIDENYSIHAWVRRTVSLYMHENE